MMCYQRFFCLMVLLTSAAAGFFLWADWQAGRHEQRFTAASRNLIRQLQLTDLAIWTEARYTRHPSQADLFTPFQEFPGALEHFPAGSLLAPSAINLDTQLKVISKAGAGS